MESENILDSIKKIRRVKEEAVVYGLYNNSNKGFLTRLNDFFIDRSKIDLKEKSYFFHMLAVMVDAGIPLVKSLKSLALRSENRRFRRVLNTIAYSTEQGSTLSDAMQRFADIFDDAEIGIVKSGEATGRLNVMLFKLSAKLDERNDLNMKLWGAAVYPIAVFSVLILVATGMLLWVFPTLLNLLSEGGFGVSELPLATRILLFIQTTLVGYWWLILILGFLVYGIFLFYKSTDYGLVRWDYFKLRIPVVGNLLRKLYVLRFVEILGLLIAAGLPVIQALTISGNSLSNRVYRLKIQELIERVKAGEKISESLADTEYLFPPEVVQMLAVGESTASLAPVSEKISVQYQKEVNNSLKKLSSVFEPVMILVVGLFVALLALAIMAPIFNLSSVVGV